MRIDWKETINGHRMIEIRNFLVALQRYRYAYCAQKYLGDDLARNDVTMRHLAKAGFVALVDDKSGHSNGKIWDITDLGCAFTCAPTTKPISRTKADQIYLGILERIDMIGKDDQYLFEVEYLLVFGSYMRDTADCGDIDLVVLLRPKAKFNEGKAVWPLGDHFAKLSLRQAREEGPSNTSYVDRLFFSRRKVKRTITNRIRSISLMCETNLEESPGHPAIPFKIGYAAHGANPAAWDCLKNKGNLEFLPQPQMPSNRMKRAA